MLKSTTSPRFLVGNKFVGFDEMRQKCSDDRGFHSHNSFCAKIGSLGRFFGSLNGALQNVGLHSYSYELKEGNEGNYPGSQHYITVNLRILFLFISAVLGWAIIWGGIYVGVDLERRMIGFAIMGVGILLPGVALLLWLLTPILIEQRRTVI